MKQVFYSKQFKKDIARIQKRGQRMSRVKEILTILMNGKKLPFACRDHKLTGDYVGHRDCHVEPDLVMIYKTDANDLYLERIGSHADLFN